MKSFKVCLLGDYAVGKTSLARRFVHAAFDDSYLTTVGVKIDTKPIDLDGEQIKLIVWDIAGADNLDALRTSYVRGAAGFLLVCDLTRAETLTSAKKIHHAVVEQFGAVPFSLLANKADLESECEISDEQLAELESVGWKVAVTSARSGHNVEESFRALARSIVK